MNMNVTKRVSNSMKSSSVSSFERWTVNEVCEWLKGIGLEGMYVFLFSKFFLFLLACLFCQNFLQRFRKRKFLVESFKFSIMIY